MDTSSCFFNFPGFDRVPSEHQVRLEMERLSQALLDSPDMEGVYGPLLACCRQLLAALEDGKPRDWALYPAE